MRIKALLKTNKWLTVLNGIFGLTIIFVSGSYLFAAAEKANTAGLALDAAASLSEQVYEISQGGSLVRIAAQLQAINQRIDQLLQELATGTDNEFGLVNDVLILFENYQLIQQRYLDYQAQHEGYFSLEHADRIRVQNLAAIQSFVASLVQLNRFYTKKEDQILQRVVPILVIILGGGVLGVFYFNIRLARALQQPINGLKKGIEHLKSGDLDYRISLLPTNELGDLGRAFNQMSRQLAESQAKLSQSRHELQLILDSAQEGIYGLDQTGKITFVNPMACRLTGYTQGEILENLQHTLLRLLLAEDTPNPQAQCPIYAEIDQGIVQRNDNAEFKRKDGSSFAVEYTRSPVFDEAGQCSGAMVTFQDISQRKQHERVLQEYTLRLERSNKELDDFAYVASHDLKAPLRAIMQLAGWIQDDLQELIDESTREYLSLMQNRICRMEKLLDDLLNYSRIGRELDQIKAVNIGELVQNLFQLINPPEGFNLICETDLPDINTLSVPLEQVLRNLMNNAIKHHDKNHGTLTVTAQAVAERFEFTVTDDGPGIPPEHHERIFGLFQTLKSRDQVEGSGMGLAIVKKILNRYQCHFCVESDGVRGTRFGFSWPTESALRDFLDE